MSDKRIEKLKKQRRFGIVAVDIEVFAEFILKPQVGIKVYDLPDDAIFISAGYQHDRHGLMMIFAHETFEKVKEGIQIPLLDVYYKKTLAVTTQAKGTE